jgi:hypothetical protein
LIDVDSTKNKHLFVVVEAAVVGPAFRVSFRESYFTPVVESRGVSLSGIEV